MFPVMWNSKCQITISFHILAGLFRSGTMALVSNTRVAASANSTPAINGAVYYIYTTVFLFSFSCSVDSTNSLCRPKLRGSVKPSGNSRPLHDGRDPIKRLPRLPRELAVKWISVKIRRLLLEFTARVRSAIE
jgi:hypothetical protein